MPQPTFADSHLSRHYRCPRAVTLLIVALPCASTLHRAVDPCGLNIELVPTSDLKSVRSWWDVRADHDIVGSGLCVVLSAVNSHIGDRPLPELKLSVRVNAWSGQSDVASAILNLLSLELPRCLQAAFFEVVQRAKVGLGGEIAQGLFVCSVTLPSPLLPVPCSTLCSPLMTPFLNAAHVIGSIKL